MTEYLDRDDVLTAGAAAAGQGARGQRLRLVARPRATVYGVDAYPETFTKAAALLQSLARNHPFVDSNKRTAWAAAWTFLHINELELDDFDVDDAESFINDVATNADLELGYIAEQRVTYAADR